MERSGCYFCKLGTSHHNHRTAAPPPYEALAADSRLQSKLPGHSALAVHGHLHMLLSQAVVIAMGKSTGAKCTWHRRFLFSPSHMFTIPSQPGTSHHNTRGQPLGEPLELLLGSIPQRLPAATTLQAPALLCRSTPHLAHAKRQVIKCCTGTSTRLEAHSLAPDTLAKRTELL